MRRARGTTGSRGLTLVEVIVAAVIASMIAAAAAASLSRFFSTRGRVEAHARASARAASAAERIALDAENLARDADLLITRFAIVDGLLPGGAAGDLQRDELLLVSRSMSRVRPELGIAEGPDQEVQFRVADGSLWRRADPGLDEYMDAGGVVAPVADGVEQLSIEATAGELGGDEWLDVWDSDYDGIPHAIRIRVTAVSDDGSTRATVRRVVAIDRVPLEGDSTTLILDGGAP